MTLQMSERDLADQDVLGHLTHAFTLFMEGDPVGAHLAAHLAMQAIPVSGPAQAALGDRLLSIDDHKGAEAALRTACELGTCDARTLGDLARALQAQGRQDEAVACYRDVLRLDPAHVEALIQLGSVALETGRSIEAMTLLRRASRLARTNVALWLMLAGVAQATGRTDLAARCNRAAYLLDPGHPAPCLALAEVALNDGHPREAQELLIRASRLDPNNAGLLSRCLSVSHLLTGQTQARLARLHRGWNGRFGRPVPPRPVPSIRPGEPLRLGLLVPEPPHDLLDWRLRPLLRHRDSSRLSIYVFSGVGARGPAWDDLKSLADRWVEIESQSPPVLDRHVREAGIDVLVDLAGHGASNHLSVFARYRPALVQVTWSRYPGTTGIRAFDAMISDAQHVLEDEDELFTEPVVRLSCGALACEPPQPLPTQQATARGGAKAPILGILAPPALAGQPSLDLWAGALRAVPKARLALVHPHWRSLAPRQAMVEAMGKRGIDPARLFNASTLDDSAPWAALMGLDVVLDSYPVSHDVGAQMALSIGIPLVTLRGRTSAGRFAAALLMAAGREYCVAREAKDYAPTIQQALGQTRVPMVWSGEAWVEEFTEAIEQIAAAVLDEARRSAEDGQGLVWEMGETVLGLG